MAKKWIYVTVARKKLKHRSGSSAELRLAGVARVIGPNGPWTWVSLWTKYMPVRTASVHCIYVYVLVYTMLWWKLWFWKGFKAANNSLYCSDASAYRDSNDDSTIVTDWMLSKQCWISLEDVQTRTSLYRDHVPWLLAYINVNSCLLCTCNGRNLHSICTATPYVQLHICIMMY